MTFRTKLIGLILIVVGALPFLLKIESVNTSFSKYTWILPGELIYQVVVVILGFLLVIARERRDNLNYLRR